MPVNFVELRNQIKEMTLSTLREQNRLKEVLARALEVLKAHANEIEHGRNLVEKAAAADPRLRCACPVEEPLDTRCPASSDIPEAVLLAADGSQINPSRHDPVQFGLVNVGAVRFQTGCSQAPREFIRSQLLYSEDLFTRQGPISEEEVALRRDLRERLLLAELAEKESLPVVALTDGPLELFREPRQTPSLKQAFQDYQKALGKLAAQKIITAGYVDKPRSDLLVRFLELAETEKNTDTNPDPHPFFGLSDLHLFQTLLQPGERSAVFAIQSMSSEDYEPALAPHFFYLNVGFPGKPHLARIEIPAWMANSQGKLQLLQAAILQQCHILGAAPYPYILQRAHEVAVVSLQEKERLQEMVQIELRSQGGDAGEKSYKQNSKDISGKRERYK